MANNTKKQVFGITIFVIILIASIFSLHPTQAIDTASEVESRVILTFDSNADKQEFLDTLQPEIVNEVKSLFTTNVNVLDESNIAEDDFGKLPIVTLDVTPQEKVALLEQLPPDTEIAPVQRKGLFLAESVPIINATQVWRINQTYDSTLSAKNVTGRFQSACVIDTGINYSHVDFTGKLIVQKCYCAAQPGTRAQNCCPGNVAESSNAMDYYGHGTHVAGIIAANGVVKGVAPDANIVAVRVFGTDDDTSTGAYDDDIIKAIQYCTDNSATYNISVISMSLGGGAYAGLCPSDTLASVIDTALVKNISVVVATGNGVGGVGRVSAIASPACVPGVTRVAATNKTNSLASFSDTNSYVSLVAPGVDIISTYYTGGYAQLNGTSMATPHVSGAILLIKNGLQSINLSQNTSQIENALNVTAKQIFSAARSRYFSRIDAYSALMYLGANINFTSPTQANATNLSQNWFVINVTANNMLARSINISIYNSTASKIWTQNSTISPFTFNYTTTQDGIYYYNATVNETQNNQTYSTQTRTITVDTTYPLIGYIASTYPDNTTIFSQMVPINISANDTNLRYVNISIYNSSNSLIWRQNGTTQVTELKFNTTYDGVYYYNATATDWFGFTNSTQTRNITVDSISLALLSYTVNVTNQTAHIYTTSDTTANITIKYGVNDSLTNTIYNTTNSTTHEVLLTSLTNSTTYYFNVTLTDSNTNSTTNGTYNFTTLGTFIDLNISEWNASETTDFTLFTPSQLENITQVNFSNDNGKITFTDSLNLSQPRNITNAIVISQNRIIVNTSILPEFNVSANLTFRNITLTHPIIKRNSVDCSTANGNCTNSTFDNNSQTYIVRVSMFSTYDLVEQCSDGVRNYDETGTDCGGANCNACASGGGGGSTKKSGSGGGAGVPAPIKKVNTTNITNVTNITPNITLNVTPNVTANPIYFNRTNSTQKEVNNENSSLFDISNIVSISALILVCVGLIFFLMRR